MAKNLTKINSDIAKIFKALSNPNRLELYREIVKNTEKEYDECLLTNIISKLRIGMPTISHHIKELTNAGLIVTEKRGKFLVCKANDKLLGDIAKIFPTVK